MSDAPQQVYLVSHTHWDREWYETFHTFRVKLVGTVRKVLTALETETYYQHFMLDGQGIVLEDHLEVHPEDADRIREHVASGRLAVGPWYILPDEFLVSGEALVRNALVGHEVCGQYGGAAPVGYMPDTFGHVAQMPQILRGCGLDNFIFWRGQGDEADDLGLGFHWEGPDGSRVLALQQASGYCNAGGLGLEEIWHAHTQRAIQPEVAVRQVEKLLDEMAPRNNLDFILLNNGCDHFPPQRDLDRVLEALRKRWPDTTFTHTSYAEVLERLRTQSGDFKTFRGELLSGKLAPILSGIWSARMPLKQQNAACQDLLTNAAEPFAAYMHHLHGVSYPQGLLDYTWKLLLKNHPHDSIGGCSVDPVHVEMMPRFAGVRETCDELLREQMATLAPHFAEQGEDDAHTTLCVANTLPMQRSNVVERLVVLEPICGDGQHIQVHGPDGKPVPTCVLEQWHAERFWYVDYRGLLRSEQQLERMAGYRLQVPDRMDKQPGDEGLIDRFVHLQFLADDLPGVGHRNYTVKVHDAPPADAPPIKTPTIDGHRIDNELVAVTLQADGTFDLEDLRSGRRFEGLNILQVEGDRGDEYDFDAMPDQQPRVVHGILPEAPPTPPDGFRRSLLTMVAVEIPWAGWQQPVTMFLDVQITLEAGSPLVQVTVTNLRNDARNTRLRALFPTPVQTETLHSDGHFYIDARPFERPSGDDWTQPSPPTWPQQDFSCIRDQHGGLALFNKGLPEIAARRTEQGSELALTLLRNVGWLSKDDLASRNNLGAGPALLTPDAQGSGPHVFEYALCPFDADTSLRTLKQMASSYRMPPLTLQGVACHAIEGGAGLLECDSDAVVVTAIKRSQDGNGLIVRLCNTSDEPSAAILRFGYEPSTCHETDLLERPGTAIDVNGNEVRIQLDGHKIQTVLLG